MEFYWHTAADILWAINTALYGHGFFVTEVLSCRPQWVVCRDPKGSKEAVSFLWKGSIKHLSPFLTLFKTLLLSLKSD